MAQFTNTLGQWFTSVSLRSRKRRSLIAGSIAVGVVILLSFGNRVIGWDIPAVALMMCLYIVYVVCETTLTFAGFGKLHGQELRDILANDVEENATLSRFEAVFSFGSRGTNFAVQSSFVALVSVIAISTTPDLRSSSWVLVLGIVTVLAAWVNNAGAFAMEYAVEHSRMRCLSFPETPIPVWSDYHYLAIQLSATFSTSDVDVTNVSMRRLITRHTIVAFLFNSVIIALLVSLLS